MLGLIYHWITLSQFLGQALSILVFTVVCLVWVRIPDILKIVNSQWLLTILFALAPATLMLTSLTMRESFQLLFLISTVYFGLRFHQTAELRFIVCAIFSSMVMGLFHFALIVCAAILILIVTLWPRPVGENVSRIRRNRIWICYAHSRI